MLQHGHKYRGNEAGLDSMTIGNPFEVYTIAGSNIPRYKIVIGVFSGLFGLYAFNKVYKSFQPRAPILFTNKEEEDYVKRYIKHHHEEEHNKPIFLREVYQGPSGQI
ncbi:hypothetical protein HK100_006786 [Physocladia obscura]|uniref:Uncharacterized protein n=1 Tax=Physocladia obscura TaxID=109957 RepID=A0AAD5SQ11_9FUNG|nr:hypothetical protein HK100_006786 [Physocladia obscura]